MRTVRINIGSFKGCRGHVVKEYEVLGKAVNLIRLFDYPEDEVEYYAWACDDVNENIKPFA